MPTRHLRELTTSNETLKKELEEARKRLRQRGTKNNQAASWVPLSNDQPKEEEETWFATYLDMMTLLLVLMLVMLAFAGASDGAGNQDGGMRVGKIQHILSGGKGVLPGAQRPGRDEGLENGQLIGDSGNGSLAGDSSEIDNNPWQHLDLSALGDDIDVILEDRAVSFRINSEILFSSAQADLSLEGLNVLKKLIPILKQSDVLITVEGHTDSVPIRNPRFPSNWELSGARAGSVVRYLESNGISSEKLRAVGYADTRPIDNNDTAEGRANNRRVELSIAVSPDEVLPASQ